MVESADTGDLKSPDVSRMGSSPISTNKEKNIKLIKVSLELYAKVEDHEVSIYQQQPMMQFITSISEDENINYSIVEVSEIPKGKKCSDYLD